MPNFKIFFIVCGSFFLGYSISSTVMWYSSSSRNTLLDDNILFVTTADRDSKTLISNTGETRGDDFKNQEGRDQFNADSQKGIGISVGMSGATTNGSTSFYSTGQQVSREQTQKEDEDKEQSSGQSLTTPRCNQEEIADSIMHLEAFQKETAVVISTHLVPSHPSLDALLEVLDSVRTYLVGLPDKCPIFITVDGVKEVYQDDKHDNLFLSADKENREKYDLYIKALHSHFKNDENVKILIAGKNVGLSENLRRVVDNLHPLTKYMYLLQHDLPFVKEINHTAIVKTANEYPEINMIRFNIKKSMGHFCDDVPVIYANGIDLKKGKKWSDQNQFARVSHYVNDIFPILSGHVFPEMKMVDVSSYNCSYYGPYYYSKGFQGPWYKHTDATERYGEKLAERVKRGELDPSLLTFGNLQEMRQSGVNTTELMLLATKQKEQPDKDKST